jgi:hypothetical protein
VNGSTSAIMPAKDIALHITPPTPRRLDFWLPFAQNVYFFYYFPSSSAVNIEIHRLIKMSVEGYYYDSDTIAEVGCVAESKRCPTSHSNIA